MNNPLKPIPEIITTSTVQDRGTSIHKGLKLKLCQLSYKQPYSACAIYEFMSIPPHQSWWNIDVYFDAERERD
jgi:hypothetical protein